MISFSNDYVAGAHPEILRRLVETNTDNQPGYGSDIYCEGAKEKIKKACKRDDIDVWFLVGGTQTNQVVISTFLAPYEGVIAASTGHVNGHEAGAIEYSGHKVLAIEGKNGKLSAASVEEYITAFNTDRSCEHMVHPGMVYISFPTEYGTLYSKAELTEIHSVCEKYNIPLFIDGARLGYGLMSDACDVTLPELCDLCEVFYIGGTKVGALCGEAVVFTKNNTPKHFLSQIKQHGALLAKGRLLGVQFDTLFTDDLYFKISRHAIVLAERLKKIFAEKGYEFFIDSPTNQQFIIMDNEKAAELETQISFGYWEKYDDRRTVLRFATSWSTLDSDIDTLEKLI